MVTYWDASAVVPLIIKEPRTELYLRIAREHGIITWWGTYVECISAVARHSRQGGAPAQVAESHRILDQLSEDWTEIGGSLRLRQAALRAIRNHHLRAGDALHFGAALIASGFEPCSARFLTEDRQLKHAAEREGFTVQ